MKKLSALFLSLLLLAGCGAAPAEEAAPAPEGEAPGTPIRAEYREISQEEAAALMESGEDYILLDVRTPAEFAEGHIPGALNLNNEDIGTEPPPELPDREQLILVYCRSGNRSRQASRKLAEMGYSNVREFGGINSWPGEIVTE